MSFMLRRVYLGLIFHPDVKHLHPLLSLFVLGIQFVLLLSYNPLILVLLLCIVEIENTLFDNLRGSLYLIRAIFPLLFFVGGLSLLFGGLRLAILIVFRLMIGALSCSFYFSVTNPSDFSRTLEGLRVPTRWAILPSLALTMVPRVAKDVQDTFETLMLRGEISGFFLKWLPRTLAIYVASILYRSESLAQSLHYRGLGLYKRTHYRSISICKLDVLRTIYWIMFIFGIVLIES
jgi:energy-coupling factor transporter transmembrane protein EcfT